MHGPAQSNSDLANFFRSHSKTSKLTKSEFNYIDSLIFSQSSPTKNSLPIFPRATPLFNSKISSFSSTALKTSRKRLEIFEQDFKALQGSFPLNEEPSVCDEFPEIGESQKKLNSGTVDFRREVPDDSSVFNSSNLNSLLHDSKTSIHNSPPRQMTDAAKELMASINMNVDSESQNDEEDIQKSTIQAHVVNLPKFEFDIPAKKLPEFKFEISEDKPEQIADLKLAQTEYKFDFNLSDFEENKSLEPSLQFKLPEFYFEINQ